MNTLYIHIGTAKTGSSALQSFLRKNNKVLEEKGYCYPKFPFYYENVSKNRNGYFLRGEKLGNKGANFGECMNIVREAFEKCPNVILSDEGIWYESFKWHEQLFGIMQEKGYQTKIIVYLRRQDEYLASRWSQFVKEYAFKHQNCKIDEGIWENYLQRSKQSPRLNYGETLKKLEKIYGRENILVRRYDRNHFPEGSICADFLQAIGLERTDEFMEAGVVNLSLSPNTTEIYRALNSVVDVMSGEGTDDAKFLRNLLLSYSALYKENYPCSMFSKEEAEELLEHYHEENSRVAREYFGEEELFSSRIKPVAKWEKNSPGMQDDIIRFMGIVCIHFLKENRKIHKELQDLKLFRSKVRHPIHMLSRKLSNK